MRQRKVELAARERARIDTRTPYSGWRKVEAAERIEAAFLAGAQYEHDNRLLHTVLRPVWVCMVARSGFHNGSTCRELDPHGGDWKCGWHYTFTTPAAKDNGPVEVVFQEVRDD